jgi:CDP-3, 6-dideoxy-D-glycero-L-glycero-4-hexulose-4-reductase
MTRHALVTGGTGFTGSHLVRALLDDGWTVRLLAQHDSLLDQLGDAAERVDVTRIPASADADAIASAVEVAFADGIPDCVFSLAISRDTTSLRAVAAAVDANVRLPAVLIAALAARGGGNIVTSASYMYGREGVAPSLFSATRGAVDPLLNWANAHGHVRSATLALTSIYGPGDSRSKLVARLVRAAQQGEAIDLVDPTRVLDHVYVDDVASAYVHAANLLCCGELDAFSRFDVSSGKLTTLSELVAHIERIAGTKIDARWGARPPRVSDQVDPSESPAWLPGWQPATTLEAGLTSTIVGSARPVDFVGAAH